MTAVKVKFEYSSGSAPTLTGGPLYNDVYILDHLHSHWGPSADSGSEHTLNGGFDLSFMKNNLS